ncbi:MAG: hypothetical protein WCI11_18975 [Candidatus Methylumidiphilus sp.]
MIIQILPIWKVSAGLFNLFRYFMRDSVSVYDTHGGIMNWIGQAVSLASNDCEKENLNGGKSKSPTLLQFSEEMQKLQADAQTPLGFNWPSIIEYPVES